jgi:hypothetical protein
MITKAREITDKILVLKPFLALLSEGKVFKLGFSWFLRILAGVFTIGFLVEWIGKWSDIFKMSGSLVLMLTIIMVLAVAVAFGVINLILVKADAIAALPETKDYIVIPIAVLFIKLIGEVSVFLCTFVGISGFFLSLTKEGAMVMRMFPFFGGSGFEAGLIGLVTALIAGFLSFFIWYFIAEQLGVLADIARNTKKN